MTRTSDNPGDDVELPEMKMQGGQASPTTDVSEKNASSDVDVRATVGPAVASHLARVSFAEYMYYARIQREEEASRPEPSLLKGGLKAVKADKTHPPVEQDDPMVTGGKDAERAAVLSELEVEKMNASRALRRAGWASVFFLITTDILGPFNAPFAFSQVGYVPGVLLYLFMGLIAAYTGVLLSYMFCKLDSTRYPVRTFGDLGFRLFGPRMRHFCSLLQTLQLIVNVGTICLSNGQSVSQISKGKLCFAVCIVIWAFVGMVIGQIRTLKAYTGLANNAVWFNLLIIFISMGVIGNSAPNIAAAVSSYGPTVASGPVTTANFVEGPLWSKVNGIMNMIFAYGGAMIFPEMMAEMRRPWDFWKGMALAQTLIFTCYMMYGLFVYSQQGQYTLALAYQGISSYAWQTVGNALALITGIIAAGLYGNIGCKIAYINIIEDMFGGPPLTSSTGKKIWSVMNLVYWALAFVVGSAIPQVQTVSGLIAAIAILQFTYTFPCLFIAAFQTITDASKADPPFVPGKPHVTVDTWRDASRWKRGIVGDGIFSREFAFKALNFTMFAGAAAMACLGMYGSGKAIQVTFQEGAATSFGCTAPV